MEEFAKAPPKQLDEGVCPEDMMAAAAATADIMATHVISTTTSTEEPISTKPAATATATKPPPTKSTKAYDKKWLENLNLLKPCIKADGSIDYSSLDEEAQKPLQNFVKDQRKCYRKRENNEATPMTDERYRLLLEAKFDFKPSETNKARSQEKKKAKKKAVKKESESAKKKAPVVSESAKKEPAAKKKSPVVPGKSSTFVASETTPAKKKTFDQVERATVSATKKKPPSNEKKLTPLKTEEQPGSDSKMPAKKSPKSASKSTTPTSARKSKSGKPTYLEMVHDAIVSLKDRSGSSSIAISKWILANNEHCKSVTPNMYKSRLNMAIKQGVKEGRFIKVKSSYKVSSEWKKKQKAAVRAKEATNKKAEKVRQKESQVAKQKKREELAEKERKRKEKEMTPEDLAEVKRKKKEKEAAEAKRKWQKEQIRKRRYPIEDTRLHREDKEWKNANIPKEVIKRPALPHTLTCLVPPHLRVNTPKNYQGPVARASTSGTGDLMGGNNDRGLVADAMTVYHFFCGDVGFEDAEHPVPKFSLKTLFYALDEVINGNAKAAKSLPPLLTHLFVTALRLLTAPQKVSGNDEDEDELEPVDVRLQEDLSQLRDGLNPVSWSQICFFYMDLMQNYYTSDVSVKEGVLPGDNKLDMSYYWNKDSMDVDDVEKSGDEEDERYKAYLGDEQGVLFKAFMKLLYQNDPWNLKAHELMALLRALTDDILAKRPELAEDIATRSAKMHELTKAKRAATIKYNKVKLAYEGPKKPMRQRKTGNDGEKGDNKDDDKKNDEKSGADSKEEMEEKPFVPTATKKQFEAAEKAYFKAYDAWENGLEKLIARTEPIGFDRNHHAIYLFGTDPSMLHLEYLKTNETKIPPELKELGSELTPFSSWHFVDTKSLYEQFLQSLDKRGRREADLLDICSNLTILKRKLQDDKSSNTRAAAREREREALERRSANAKAACDAEDGRRSGRLAGMAQSELDSVKQELEELAKAHEEEERQEKIGRDKASDYTLLTGLQSVTELYASQRSTRSHRKSDDNVQTEADGLANVPSHKLWLDERIGGNGTLNVLVEALFALEKKCNDLSPLERQEREAWRKQLSDASCAWAIDCVMKLGPAAKEEKSTDGSDTLADPSPAKKQKIEPSSGTSLANIVNTVKTCLKDLELRVFEISGKKRSLKEGDLVAEDKDEETSDEEDDEELLKRRNNWKVKVNALKRIPTQKYTLIRDILVAAITVARKSHNNQVAAELKTALQLVRPQAAGEARSAALAILDKYGGYDGEEDEEDDFDELAAINVPGAPEDEEDAAIASLLCDEFRMINGNLGGDDEFADESDWSDAIKECKSISRVAVLLQSFLGKADAVLDQIKEDRDSLNTALRSKTGMKKHISSDNVWCNVKVTDKLVKARVSGFPWWPAHMCIPLDSDVAAALEGSGHSIIASVGNASLYMVPEKDIVDFAIDTDEEDLEAYNIPNLREDLQDAMAIAKKLWKGQNKGVASPWRKKSRSSLLYSEEKKEDGM